MNPATIAVLFLAIATVLGMVLQPTEAEVKAGNAAPAAPDDGHGRGGHGGHDHGHGH